MHNLELPELAVLAGQMNREIAGKRIIAVEVANPKCLNMPLEKFKKAVIGRRVKAVENKGKWLFINLNSENLLLFNPGMGADIIYYSSADEIPEKRQIKIDFHDGTGFTIRVWWFCYLHLIPKDKIKEHKLAGKIGPSPLAHDFTLLHFKQLLDKNRGNIKSFLLDQKNMAGIGNVYVQDPLFKAGIHPKRRINSLTDREAETLYRALRSELTASIKLGGLAYEKDFYGKNGKYGKAQFQVAYKQGQQCPVCGTAIEKIKTGSTSSFICPTCQKLPG